MWICTDCRKTSKHTDSQQFEFCDEDSIEEVPDDTIIGWPDELPPAKRYKMSGAKDGEPLASSEGYFAKPLEGPPVFVIESSEGCVESGEVYTKDAQASEFGVVEWFTPLP